MVSCWGGTAHGGTRRQKGFAALTTAVVCGGYRVQLGKGGEGISSGIHGVVDGCKTCRGIDGSQQGRRLALDQAGQNSGRVRRVGW